MRYFEWDPPSQTLHLHGAWVQANLAAILTAYQALPAHPAVCWNAQALQALDTSGAAWLAEHSTPQLLLQPAHLALLERVRAQNRTLPVLQPTPGWLEGLGRASLNLAQEAGLFLNFIGETLLVFLRLLRTPQRLRLRSFACEINSTGTAALPIIGLLSALVGVVLTYQMGLQLKTYGANIFIVDLLGLAILREFAPLLTAIIVTGRSGSAFTAQIGTMQVNEEIDALQTLGVSPHEILVLPKVWGLMVTLPLLTTWSMLFGMLGGLWMSGQMLDLHATDFVRRFGEVVTLNSLLIGLGKAPVFAALIGLTGCFQGLQVKRDAASVGEHTTRSVVESIFFIIVADALFSIVLSHFKL